MTDLDITMKNKHISIIILIPVNGKPMETGQ